MRQERIENVVGFEPFRVPATWFESDTARGTVLLLPALGTAARYYRPFAEALCSARFSALVPEIPGTGDSRPHPSRQFDYGYSDLVTRYLPGLVSEATQRGNGAPLLIAGHSLGGQIGALGILSGRVKAHALITLASGDIHYRNWPGPGAIPVFLMAVVAAALAGSFGYLPGHYLGFGGPQAKTLMIEWSRFIRNGRLPLATTADGGGVEAPCLCIGYAGDHMAPPTSVAALAGRLKGECVTLPVDWPGRAHLSWARHPGATVTCLTRWLAGAGIVEES